MLREQLSNQAVEFTMKPVHGITSCAAPLGILAHTWSQQQCFVAAQHAYFWGLQLAGFAPCRLTCTQLINFTWMLTSGGAPSQRTSQNRGSWP